MSPSSRAVCSHLMHFHTMGMSMCPQCQGGRKDVRQGRFRGGDWSPSSKPCWHEHEQLRHESIYASKGIQYTMTSGNTMLNGPNPRGVRDRRSCTASVKKRAVS